MRQGLADEHPIERIPVKRGEAQESQDGFLVQWQGLDSMLLALPHNAFDPEDGTGGLSSLDDDEPIVILVCKYGLPAPWLFSGFFNNLNPFGSQILKHGLDVIHSKPYSGKRPNPCLSLLQRSCSRRSFCRHIEENRSF